jgi:hypothetical protein
MANDNGIIFVTVTDFTVVLPTPSHTKVLTTLHTAHLSMVSVASSALSFKSFSRHSKASTMTTIPALPSGWLTPSTATESAGGASRKTTGDAAGPFPSFALAVLILVILLYIIVLLWLLFAWKRGRCPHCKDKDKQISELHRDSRITASSQELQVHNYNRPQSMIQPGPLLSPRDQALSQLEGRGADRERSWAGSSVYSSTNPYPRDSVAEPPAARISDSRTVPVMFDEDYVQPKATSPYKQYNPYDYNAKVKDLVNGDPTAKPQLKYEKDRYHWSQLPTFEDPKRNPYEFNSNPNGNSDPATYKVEKVDDNDPFSDPDEYKVEKVDENDPDAQKYRSAAQMATYSEGEERDKYVKMADELLGGIRKRERAATRKREWAEDDAAAERGVVRADLPVQPEPQASNLGLGGRIRGMFEGKA